MANYPFAANFLAQLPPYPIKQACEHMRSITSPPDALLTELFKGISVYFNTSTTAKCLDYKSFGQPSDLGDYGWDLQSCTEMVMPICSNNKDDMFDVKPWNITAWSQYCQNTWGTEPQVNKMP